MVIPNEVDLPTIASLDTTELDLSTATLMSAAPYLGKACENVNNEFMLCRQEMNDPRQCVELGKRVTQCALQLFKRIKKNCLEEFNQYTNCVDKSSGDFSYKLCRKTQAAFDDCMLSKLCMQRPDFGYFCRARVHESGRSPPPPAPCPCHSVVPDATPALPDCAPKPAARFGARSFWAND